MSDEWDGGRRRDEPAPANAVTPGSSAAATSSDRPDQPHHSSLITHHSSLAVAAALIMLGNVLSRLLAIGRETVTAYYFGLSAEMGAFTLADNVRTMLYDLLLAGMISAALVPVLSDYAEPARRAELRRIVGTLLLLALLGAGAIVGLLMLLAPQVTAVMTALVIPVAGAAGSGPAPDPALTAALVRAILPAVLLLCLAAILLAALQALQRFQYYALSLLVPNAALIAAVLLLHDRLGIMSLVAGTVLGAGLLVVLALPGLRDLLRPAGVAPGHPAVRRIGRLYLPIFLGLIVSTVALILDRNFASAIGADALAAMRYATQVQQMALGLVAAAIALATLPALAQAAGAGDHDAFTATLAAGLRLIVVLIVPATLGLLALAAPVVELLFRHGATDAGGAALITLALLCYLPGLPFAAVDQLLIFAYYARKNTRTPVLVGVLAVLVYLAVALALLRPLGLAGLVLANSAQFVAHALVMLWLARRSLGSLGPHRLGHALRAALLAGLPVALLAYGLAALLGPLPGLAGEAARVALPAAAGAAVYVWLLGRLGVPDLAQIGRLAAGRLRAARQLPP